MLIRRLPARVMALAMMMVALASSPAGAQSGEPHWQAVATAAITPGADRVALSIRRDVGAGSFRIRVDGGSVHIRSVLMTAEHAPVKDVPLRLVLGPGETTDLPASATRVRDLTILVTPASSEGVSLTILAPAAARPVAAPRQQGHSPPTGEDRGELPANVRAIAAGAILTGASATVIPLGRDKGRLDWIGIQVAEGSTNLAEVRITLAGGEVVRFGVGGPATAGDVIALALPGEAGYSVSSISVLPAPNLPPRGRTVIKVLARYAPGWTGETGENRQMSAGWVLAGAVRPAGRRSERQVVAVGDDLGRYRRLRLVARNGDVDVRDITIAGSDGGRETRSINQPLLRDQLLAPIDLAGARQVDRVTVSARARSAHAPETVLEVWLQH
jgi:hypothetical protein